MTYIEKERLLIDKLRETNYAAFNGNKTDALDFVEKNLSTIAKCPTAIAKADINAMTHKTDEATTEADNAKKTAAASAINSIIAVNDLCDKLGIPKFMDIDLNNGDAIGQAVGDYMKEIFFSSIGTH